MPRPLYVICSESGSEDRETGLLSIYNVVDKLQVHNAASPEQRQNAPLTQLRITSVWMSEPGDEGNEFEFEVVLRPPHGEEFKAGRGTFTFALPFFRIVAKIIGPLPIKGEGTLWVESRARKIGTKGWKAHEIPIIIEKLPAPVTSEVTVVPEKQASPETSSPRAASEV